MTPVASCPRWAARASAAALTAALLVLAPTAAWALWSAQAQLAAEATVGVVKTPANLMCATTSSGLLGLLTESAQLTWDPPPAPAPTGYEVRITNEKGETATVRVTGTSIVLRDGLSLPGLTLNLGGFLGGGTGTASVATVHSSGWLSAPTAVVKIKRTLLGIACG